jgi:hypothetical protein
MSAESWENNGKKKVRLNAYSEDIDKGSENPKKE